MNVSAEKARELLERWRSSDQEILLSMSGGQSSVSQLLCSGKVGDITHTEFIIAWGQSKLVRLSLSAKFAMDDGEDSLQLLYPDGEAVILTEALL